LERERSQLRRVRRQAAIADSEMIRLQRENIGELSKIQG
jgi:hypothetical protein